MWIHIHANRDCSDYRIKYKDPAGRERFWESAERATRPTSSAVDGVGIVAILEDRRKREAGERQGALEQMSIM